MLHTCDPLDCRCHPPIACTQKAFAAERIQALADVGRAQEVDAAACHAVMMRKQEELMQRLHKAEEALQHSTRDYILCKPVLHGSKTQTSDTIDSSYACSRFACETACYLGPVHSPECTLSLSSLSSTDQNLPVKVCRHEVRVAPNLHRAAGRRAKEDAETRAVAAEAALKQLRAQSAREVQQVKDVLADRLQQAQTAAEQRVEQHTEEYRLQVSPNSDPVPARDFSLGPLLACNLGLGQLPQLGAE